MEAASVTAQSAHLPCNSMPDARRVAIEPRYLLELMRLAYLRVDRTADYSIDIRGSLDAHNGRLQRRYRETYDAMFDEAGTHQFNSLWAIPAQIAIREAQAKVALKKLPPQ